MFDKTIEVEVIATTRVCREREENNFELAGMETPEEKKKRQKEEEKLLKKLMKQSRLRAIVRERQKRIELLTRLADDHRFFQDRPTMKLRGYTTKKRRGPKILKDIKRFISRQEDARNANYFDETLKNESAEPEYKVTSMITVQKLKETIGSIRPINININYAINEEEFEKDIRFLRDEDIQEAGNTVKWIESERQPPLLS